MFVIKYKLYFFLRFSIVITLYVINYNFKDISLKITTPKILAGRKCVGGIPADRSLQIIVYVTLLSEIFCMRESDHMASRVVAGRKRIGGMPAGRPMQILIFVTLLSEIVCMLGDDQ